MFCNKCGNQVDDGSAFCPGCGEKFNTNANPAVGASSGSPAKKPNLIPILIGIIAVVLVVFLGSAVLGGGDKGKIKKTIASFEKAMRNLDEKAISKCMAKNSTSDIASGLSYLTGIDSGMKLDINIDVKKINMVDKTHAEVDVVLKMKVFGYSDNQDQTIYMVKEGGKWLISN